jgi:hypothetical protein
MCQREGRFFTPVLLVPENQIGSGRSNIPVKNLHAVFGGKNLTGGQRLERIGFYGKEENHGLKFLEEIRRNEKEKGLRM